MIRNDREGFALPLTIMLTSFLAVGLMAAFSRGSTESRIVDDQRSEQRAYVLASAGLEQHVVEGGRVLAADSTTGRLYTYPGGTARVHVRMIRRGQTSLDTSTYLITSVGRTAAGANRPSATRTVSILTHRVGSTIPVMSSWTSLTGLHKNGNAGDINGTDHGTCADKIGNVVAGAAVPKGTFTGHDNAFSGSPPIENTNYTQQQLADMVGVDWKGMTDPTWPTFPKVSPDYRHCTPSSPNYVANLGPCGAFPTTSQLADWPVTMVNGDWDGDVQGNGILIVTGNLNVKGNSKWRGVILVGGWMRDDGISDVEGAVISGLNVIKGETVDISSIGNGTKFYRYNSCAIAQAASGMAWFSQLPDTWVDNRWSL